jgi:hypothetical protein
MVFRIASLVHTQSMDDIHLGILVNLCWVMLIKFFFLKVMFNELTFKI